MKRLGKKANQIEMTIEAYACKCSSASCGCNWYCECTSNVINNVVFYAAMNSQHTEQRQAAGDALQTTK